jgi:hypothetical protein
MEGLDTLWRTDDQDVRPADKKTRLNDTGDQVQSCFQFTRLVNTINMSVEDQIPCFSFKRGPVAFSEHHTALRQRFYCTRGTAPPK